MLIKNLTNKQQSFDVKEITGENKVYTIYVTPYGSTEVDRVLLVNPMQYAGILEIDGKPIVHKETIQIPINSLPKVENKLEESIEVEEDTPVVETTVAEDSFICDICGAEFASARGLAAHKNKSHTNE